MPIGSLIDLTFVSSKNKRGRNKRNFDSRIAKAGMARITKVSNEQLVSTDIIGEPYGSIVDLGFTKVIDGDLVKIFPGMTTNGLCGDADKAHKNFKEIFVKLLC